jgi:hypothetical protein
MRIGLIALALLVVAGSIFVPWLGLVVAFVLLAAIPVIHGPGERGRLIVAAAWLLGSSLLALGLTQLAWRDALHGAFVWVAGAGGILVVIGYFGLPAITRGRGSVFLASGLALTLLGWGFAFVGGFLVTPFALLLYAIGIVRARQASPAATCLALGALTLAVAGARWLGFSTVVASEIATAAALVIGVELTRRTGALRRRAPQGA